MHRSTAILLLATAVLAGTTIASWRAFMAERSRADALQAQIGDEDPPVSIAVSEPSPGFEGSTGRAGAPIDTQVKAVPTNPEIFPELRRRLQNEAYREARRRVRTLELSRGFIDLARVLGIPQKTADRLLALLVENELKYSERPQFNPRNDKELAIRQLEGEQARAERNAGIAALIGAGNLPKWEQYEASLPIRHEVRELAANVFATVEPLREDQREALIQAMYSERQRVRQELSEYTESLVWTGGMESQSHVYRRERQVELMKAASSRIHAEAATFLSAGQLKALDDQLRRENEMQDAEFDEIRALLEAEEVSDDEAISAARRSRQP